ncbi:hypothetical protein DUNSADRAFT_2633 [Dunaliella salina]|uniref:Uncharacterized protein n=1 Tax=Dunaliella salina TaxID=3046 RepID=A0ABQ7FW81_DUNSA|nr:hypothetical protein DUNSADRAFT_2633 [Dunaliella salina]|eukprot:KAF5826582.1 hypothetical protein DUNSADRAFT_2633 [Dunaliella salina]
MFNPVLDVLQVTALFLAAQKNHTQVIKVLLQHGADPGVQVSIGSKKDRCTPAQIAALNGHPITAMFLRNTARQRRQKRSSTTSLGSSGPANSAVFGRGTLTSSAASSAVDDTRSRHLSPAPSLALAPSLVQAATPRSSARELNLLASDSQVDFQPTSAREEALRASDPQPFAQPTSPATSRLIECSKHGSQDVGLREGQQVEGEHVAAVLEPGGQRTQLVDTPFARAKTQEGEQLEQQQQQQQQQQEHNQDGQQQHPQQQQQHEQNGQVQQLPTQPQHRPLTLAQQQKLQRHRQRVQQERKQQEEKEEQERRKQERLQQQQRFTEEQVQKRQLKKQREEKLRELEQGQQLPPTLQPAVSRMSSLSSNESLFGGTKGPHPTQPSHEGNTENGVLPDGLSSSGTNTDPAQAETAAQVYLPLPPKAGIKAVLLDY